MTTDDLLSRAARDLGVVPPEEFVALRADWVRRAKEDGDRQTGTAIAALRKPTRSAWLLNRLSRSRPELIADLLTLGADLRRAQRHADGAALRTLTARRRDLVATLLTAATEDTGTVSASVRDDLLATFGAALVRDDVATALSDGTLTRAGAWEGFGPEAASHLTLVHSAPAAAARPPVEPSATGTTDSVSSGRPADPERASGPEPPAPAAAHPAASSDPEAPEVGSAEPDPATDRDSSGRHQPVPGVDGGDPGPTAREATDLDRRRKRDLARDQEHRRRRTARQEWEAVQQRHAADLERRDARRRELAARRVATARAAYEEVLARLTDVERDLVEWDRRRAELVRRRDDLRTQADLTRAALADAHDERPEESGGSPS